MAALHDSRRDLVTQLEGLMRLLQPPGGSPRPGGGVTAGRRRPAPPPPPDPTLGRVQQAFSQPAAAASQPANSNHRSAANAAAGLRSPETGFAAGALEFYSE